jgi:hypothetical protein
MSYELDELLSEVTMRPPIPSKEIDEFFAEFLREVGQVPHRDYIEFMRRHNGCDGAVGQKGYVRIWPLEEVVTGNEEAGTDEFAPRLLLFAGDGGGEAYAFDRQDPRWPIVAVPLVGLSRKEMKPVAATFTEFIRKLAADEVW